MILLLPLKDLCFGLNTCIHKSTAGRVDDDHARLHLGDACVVDQVLCGLHQRAVKGKNVAMGQHIVKVHVLESNLRSLVVPWKWITRHHSALHSRTRWSHHQQGHRVPFVGREMRKSYFGTAILFKSRVFRKTRSGRNTLVSTKCKPSVLGRLLLLPTTFAHMCYAQISTVGTHRDANSKVSIGRLVVFAACITITENLYWEVRNGTVLPIHAQGTSLHFQH